MEAYDRRVTYVAPMGLDKGPQESYTVVIRPEDNLIGMKRQVQLPFEKVLQARDHPFEVIAAVVHDVKIIDITSVVLTSQGAFDKLVEAVQKNIAEQLRSNVANGQPHIVRSVEQTLRRRQPLPIRRRSQHGTVLRRIAIEDNLNQIVDQPAVESLRPKPPIVGRLVPTRIDALLKYPLHNLAVDTHEVSAQVELEDMGRQCIVARTTPHVMLEAFDPDENPLANPAGVTVINHARVEHGRNIVIEQPAYYAVGKRRSKNLAFHRHVGNEAYRLRGNILPSIYALTQIDEVTLEVELETELTTRITFVLPRVEVGPKEVVQQIGSALFHNKI